MKHMSPREMQIYLQSRSQPSIVNAYLLAVPIVVGDGLNAYSIDLQGYKFPQNTQIIRVAVYLLGQEETDKNSSLLTIQKIEFIKNKLPSSCNQ